MVEIEAVKLQLFSSVNDIMQLIMECSKMGIPIEQCEMEAIKKADKGCHSDAATRTVGTQFPEENETRSHEDYGRHREYDRLYPTSNVYDEHYRGPEDYGSDGETYSRKRESYGRSHNYGIASETTTGSEDPYQVYLNSSKNNDPYGVPHDYGSPARYDASYNDSMILESGDENHSRNDGSYTGYQSYERGGRSPPRHEDSYTKSHDYGNVSRYDGFHRGTQKSGNDYGNYSRNDESYTGYQNYIKGNDESYSRHDDLYKESQEYAGYSSNTECPNCTNSTGNHTRHYGSHGDSQIYESTEVECALDESQFLELPSESDGSRTESLTSGGLDNRPRVVSFRSSVTCICDRTKPRENQCSCV